MRWRTGQCRLLRAALPLLQILHNGRIPGKTDDWRGFPVFGDKPFTAAGYRYSARDIEGHHFMQDHAECLDRRTCQLAHIIADLPDKLPSVSGVANGRVLGRADAPPPDPKRVEIG